MFPIMRDNVSWCSFLNWVFSTGLLGLSPEKWEALCLKRGLVGQVKSSRLTWHVLLPENCLRGVKSTLFVHFFLPFVTVDFNCISCIVLKYLRRKGHLLYVTVEASLAYPLFHESNLSHDSDVSFCHIACSCHAYEVLQLLCSLVFRQ